MKTERECQWTAQPEVGWLSITAGSNGQGPGTVQYAVGANADPATRTGTVTVNGQRAQVTQAAGECKFDLSSNATSLPKTGGTGSVDVHASSALCTWTATSDASWISVTSNASGKGSAPVAFNVAATTGPPRTAMLTIAGIHFTVTQSEGCTYNVSPTTVTAGAAGGSQSVNVATSAGCPWTAASNQPWITVASGATGSGAGTVTFNVAAASGPARSGTLTVAGQAVTVTQGDACSFAISPDSQSVAPSGGSATVSVAAPAGCGWSASSNVPWISITSGGSGSGNGTVNITVASTNGPSRSGTVTIAGKTFTVNQGQGCDFSLSATSASAPASGATGTFDVRTAEGCGWSAASNVSWVTVTAGATGTGNGTVRYTVAANTGPDRSAIVTAGGQAFTITQGAGCSATVAPDTIAVPAAAGPQNVAITTAAGCAWTAVSNAAWISIPTNNTNGTGNATVRLDIQANTATARTGTATIAGKAVTINQASGCQISLNPSSQAAGAGNGSGSVAVTAGAGCTWTAVSGAAWIVVTAGASGSGNGTVQFTFQANTTNQPRTGTITIGGQQFTINQAKP